METDTDECFVKVTDLTENSKYRFRVKAVNKAGIGPPSEPSEEVTCKIRNAPPLIDRTNLDHIRVRIGEAIKLDVKITGEPVPEKSWKLAGKELKSTAAMTITYEDYKTKFLIVSARRQDSGTYVIKAQNKNGVDEADVGMLVVGPPTPPVGPLKIEDVFEDRCKVEYKVPKDDGGSPITHYIIEKMDVEVGTWVACGKSTELWCDVLGLEKMHEYQFRVKAVNSEGESEPLEGLDSIIAKNPFDPPGPPGKPICNDYDYDHFDFKWDEPRHNGGSKITAYIIERRVYNDDLWVKSGEVKLKLELGTATGVELGETYVFRVRAVNAAGPGAPGPESDNLTCRYKKLKPKINRKVLKEITIPVGETIEFDVDIQGEPPPDVTWSKNGKTLTDTDARRITDKPYRTIIYVDEATRKDDGVYLLSAVNIHGKDAAEVRVNVVSRPGPPEGPLEVSGVHKNGCKLAWKPPKDDGGLPITGYVVEKLDVDTGIWSPVGRTEGLTIPVDGLEPGKEYEFRVRAVNDEGESDNLQTLKPITAKDPFTVPLPPSAPEVVDWSEDHMALEWNEPLDDGGSPITGYIIEQKSRHDLEWTEVNRIEGNRRKGTASGLTEGEEYQFRIIALNKAGPSEPGQPSRPKEARARFSKCINMLYNFIMKMLTEIYNKISLFIKT
jgi:predicted phage tail protein